MSSSAAIPPPPHPSWLYANTPINLNFDPPESIAVQIISDLCSPEATLASIAERAQTTLEQLTRWMAQPTVAERIDNFESACARRGRLLATNTIPAVVATLSRTLQEYDAEESRLPPPPLQAPQSPFATGCRPPTFTEVHGQVTKSITFIEQRRRARETARRAAALLLRIAKFTPGPSPTRRAEASDAPPPKGGGGSRVRSARADGVVPAPTFIPLDQLLAFLAKSNPVNGTSHHTVDSPAVATPAESRNPEPISTPLAVPSTPVDVPPREVADLPMPVSIASREVATHPP